MLARLLAEQATQLRHDLVEVVLLDDDVRPERLEQLLFGQELARSLDEVQQCVEEPRRQRNRLAVGAVQDAALGVQAEPLEPVHRLPSVLCHGARNPAFSYAASRREGLDAGTEILSRPRALR